MLGAQLLLLEGARVHAFALGLGKVELDWLAQQIDAHLEARCVNK
jgi:hypothetical protein